MSPLPRDDLGSGGVAPLLEDDVTDGSFVVLVEPGGDRGRAGVAVRAPHTPRGRGSGTHAFADLLKTPRSASKGAFPVGRGFGRRGHFQSPPAASRSALRREVLG